MTLVAVGSLRGAPGATTTVVALAAVWDRPGRSPLVVEADPDGGVLAARFGLGHQPSLTELGVRARGAAVGADVWEFAQELPGGLPVVVAHPSAERCHATLRAVGPAIADTVAGLVDHDALVDVGRLRPGSPAMAIVDRADVVVVVLRPRLDELDAAAHRLGAAVDVSRARLVLVGEEPYAAAEVSAALGVAVLGVLADDARAAGVLSGRTRRAKGLGHLPLLRSARALASSLADHLDAIRPDSVAATP